MTALEFRLSSTVLGTPDPRGLASFHRDLLSWEVLTDPAGHPFCLFAPVH